MRDAEPVTMTRVRARPTRVRRPWAAAHSRTTAIARSDALCCLTMVLNAARRPDARRARTPASSVRSPMETRTCSSGFACRRCVAAIRASFPVGTAWANAPGTAMPATSKTVVTMRLRGIQDS